MEVVGERPPPLPPKSRINRNNFHSVDQSIPVRYEEGPKDGFCLGGRNFVTLPRIGVAADRWEDDGRRETLKSQTGKSLTPRIITWAQKNLHGENKLEVDDPLVSINSYYKSESDNDDFLYQNVSNSGTNYLEYKLNGIIKKNRADSGEVRNSRMESEGWNSGSEKCRSPMKQMGNRKIEVRQVQNKTVVKISIKDDFAEDEVSRANGMREERARKARGSCDTFGDCGDGYYANVSDGDGARSSSDKSEDGDLNVYANWNGNDPEQEIPVYENQEYGRSGRSSGEASPAEGEAEDRTYENQVFVSQDSAYENLNGNTSRGNPRESAPNAKSEKSSAVIDLTNPKTCLFVNVNQADGEKEESQQECRTLGASDSLRAADPDGLLQKLKGRKVVVTISSLQSDKVDANEIRKDDPEMDNSPTGHKRAESFTSSGVGVDSEESDDADSNISCDSLNSNELNALSTSEDHGYHTPNSENKTGSPTDCADYQNIGDEAFVVHRNGLPGEEYENVAGEADEIYENCIAYDGGKRGGKKSSPPPPPPKPKSRDPEEPAKSLPRGLLRDIQNVKLSAAYPRGEKDPSRSESSSKKTTTFGQLFTRDEAEEGKPNGKPLTITERTYEDRKASGPKCDRVSRLYDVEVDTDKFYKFHLFEKGHESGGVEKAGNEDETFAGVKDYLNREKQAAIKSAKGTIRGVKNRVKAGIATFLQMHENKTYKDRDSGKIVVYSTTLGIVRETYQNCLKVKQILRTHMVKFEDRDVFMSTEAQDEIRDRMKCNAILVPQVFVEGQHIGDAETIERLNESGELRKILKPYKSADAGSTCQVCGGYRLLPCSACKGSKKSIHRNHFAAGFVALKCMNCDQVGLTKCHAC